jgi:hypothetical protein
MKACNKCGVVKPLEDFHRAPGCRDGRRGDCIECFRAAANARNAANPQANRDRVRRWQEENPERYREKLKEFKQSPAGKRSDRKGHLRRKFGMSLEDYDELVEKQGGVCAVCGYPPDEGKSFHIDHDHDSGRIRGLLCSRCNHAIGLLRDDPEVIESALTYLAASRRIDALRREVAG